MEKKNKEMSQEEFLATVHGFSEEKNEDLLTDPALIAASSETDKSEGSIGPGERLKAMREKKGLSIDELSEVTGIDSSIIEEVECGNRSIHHSHSIKPSGMVEYRAAAAGGEHVVFRGAPDRFQTVVRPRLHGGP